MSAYNPITTEFHAFTNSANGIALKLTSEVVVCNGTSSVKALALWDTGATCSCLSKDVIKSLGLIPTGKTRIQTPSGSNIVDTYLVNIILPNKVNVMDVVATDSDIGDQGLGMLIGMNVITIGDFSVSNVDKKTVFSFRIPSVKRIDYVKEAAFQNTIGKKHGKGKKK